eukprot:scaffold55608_cov67-Phaeocystis_antarctica.AAC.6
MRPLTSGAAFPGAGTRGKRARHTATRATTPANTLIRRTKARWCRRFFASRLPSARGDSCSRAHSAS